VKFRAYPVLTRRLAIPRPFWPTESTKITFKAPPRSTNSGGSISLSSGIASGAAADWDRVVAAASDLMEPLDMYPERYRVAGFPSEQQLVEMGAGPIE
jgi:hypothetical protein